MMDNPRKGKASLTQVTITYHILTWGGHLLCRPPRLCNKVSGKPYSDSKMIHEAVAGEKFVELTKSRWNKMCPHCLELARKNPEAYPGIRDETKVPIRQGDPLPPEQMKDLEPVGAPHRPGSQFMPASNQKEINRRLLAMIDRVDEHLWGRFGERVLEESEIEELENLIENGGS